LQCQAIGSKDLEAVVATLHIETNDGKVNLSNFLQQGAALLSTLIQSGHSADGNRPASSAVDVRIQAFLPPSDPLFDFVDF